MRVIILGAGVIGVASAWYLAKAGHEVVVIDRQPASAMETSFANAGQLSFGYTTPWAAPGLSYKALRWMLRPDSPLIIHPRLNRAMLTWLWGMWRNCRLERYQHNKAVMIALSSYSRMCFASLKAEVGLEYCGAQQGTLQLFRDPRQFELIYKDTHVLEADGIPFELLDAAACIGYEPGLQGAAYQLVGGLRFGGDETGDCHLFTQGLARLAAAAGVVFAYDTHIKAVELAGGQVAQIHTSRGLYKGDAYLVCLGSFTPHVLPEIATLLPIYPIKGYSITVPVTKPELAPRSTVLDDTYKVAVTRLGERIRVGGMAEISGYQLRYPEARRALLAKALALMFNGAYDASFVPKLWSGLRPATPDSIPIISRGPYANLYVNAGHGTLGWTMAAGSGQLIADLLSGVQPAINSAPFSMQRRYW